MIEDYPESVSGALHYIAFSARLLPERLGMELSQEWERARSHDNPARRRLSWLLLTVYAFTALLVVALPAVAGMNVIAG